MTTSAKHALPVRNPRTGEVDFELTPATAAEITALAGGLSRAQGTWAAAGVEHRAEVLRRWADAIEKDHEVIGDAEMADTGPTKRGVISLGFTMTAHPARSAGMASRVDSRNGWFHGLITPTRA